MCEELEENTMNRTFTAVIVLSFLLSLAALPALSATLSRDMPSRVDPGSAFTVKLSVPDAVSGESLTVEETLPAGVTLSSWDVSGVKESKSDIQKDPQKYRVKGNAYGWSVTPTGPVTISYTAKAPSSQGSLSFDAVWFDKSGFNHNAATLSVSPAPAPAAAPSPAPQPVSPPQPTPAPQPKPAPAKAPAPAGSNMWLWIVGLLILVGAVWYYYKSQK